MDKNNKYGDIQELVNGGQKSFKTKLLMFEIHAFRFLWKYPY